MSNFNLDYLLKNSKNIVSFNDNECKLIQNKICSEYYSYICENNSSWFQSIWVLCHTNQNVLDINTELFEKTKCKHRCDGNILKISIYRKGKDKKSEEHLCTKCIKNMRFISLENIKYDSNDVVDEYIHKKIVFNDQSFSINKTNKKVNFINEKHENEIFICNNTWFTVTDFHLDKDCNKSFVQIELEGEVDNSVWLPLEWFLKEFKKNFNFASTIHSFQGSTSQNIIVYLNSNVDSKLINVSISRHIKTCDIYFSNSLKVDNVDIVTINKHHLVNDFYSLLNDVIKYYNNKLIIDEKEYYLVNRCKTLFSKFNYDISISEEEKLEVESDISNDYNLRSIYKVFEDKKQKCEFCKTNDCLNCKVDNGYYEFSQYIIYSLATNECPLCKQKNSLFLFKCNSDNNGNKGSVFCKCKQCKNLLTEKISYNGFNIDVLKYDTIRIENNIYNKKQIHECRNTYFKSKPIKMLKQLKENFPAIKKHHSELTIHDYEYLLGYEDEETEFTQDIVDKIETMFNDDFEFLNFLKKVFC
jgi:hypothetical protein